MVAKRFVHDPDCAVTQDAAETADWDDPEYRAPKCTCAERQKARRRATSATHTNRSHLLEGCSKLGSEGCYWRGPLPRYG